MKKKIIITLFLIALALVLYLVMTSESVSKEAETEITANKQAASLEDAYEARARELFIAFEATADSGDFSAEKLTELKAKLLGLTVPARFKELHLKFVQLLDKMAGGEKALSRQMASQLKADYGWLNK